MKDNNYKERLFFQYAGQKACIDKETWSDYDLLTTEEQRLYVLLTPMEAIYENLWHDFQDTCLALTDIKDITEEHAIECVKIQSDIYKRIEIIPNKGYYAVSFSFEYETSRRRRKRYIDLRKCNPNIIDYLRKNGYAVPYDGKSVEDQVNEGYVKLKSQK